ncbi:DNA cytosine methyltransferase [Rhodopseudomonas sp.]|uniref:DNA cytosine methyltransferase n=1 Tax=Rhodopseudomonas sp. TaxID=1078 RepID=UPI0039C9EFA6
MAVRTNIISLCTGGGGLDLGVELAIPGARSVVYVEREALPVAHLVSAMQAGFLAEAPIWSDVGTFDGRPWRGLVDGLIGGIPCQPHSVAGLRLADRDERDLWSPARRIIVQARPCFVFIENVSGFVSSGGLFRVWRDLRRLGYETEVGLFTASEVGASHRRERCFVLAVADASGSRLEGHERRAAPGQRERTTPPRSIAELRRARMVFEGIERQYPAHLRCSHQHPINVPSGIGSSPAPRTLNPLFVEWLMGWPWRWTLVAWIGFGCSATELSRWKRHMRSALLKIDSPSEPVVQHSLFG